MLIDGVYVVTDDEARQQRARELLELDEAVKFATQVDKKIRATAEDLSELSKKFRSAATAMESERKYKEEQFSDQLELCKTFLDPEILKGLIEANKAAQKRLDKAKDAAVQK